MNTPEWAALKEAVDLHAKTMDNEERSFCGTISKQRTKKLRAAQQVNNIN